MSHIRVKTYYNEEGTYGSVDKHILYADHNNSCDLVSFYDEDGRLFLVVPDTLDHNLLDAINRLYVPCASSNDDLKPDIEYMTPDDRKIIDTYKNDNSDLIQLMIKQSQQMDKLKDCLKNILSNTLHREFKDDIMYKAGVLGNINVAFGDEEYERWVEYYS